MARKRRSRSKLGSDGSARSEEDAKKYGLRLYDAVVRTAVNVDLYAGTTCSLDGGAENGGRTLVAIRAPGMAWALRIEHTDGHYEDVVGPHGICFGVEGDAEGVALADALAWAARLLRRESHREQEPSVVRELKSDDAIWLPAVGRTVPEAGAEPSSQVDVQGDSAAKDAKSRKGYNPSPDDTARFVRSNCHALIDSLPYSADTELLDFLLKILGRYAKKDGRGRKTSGSDYSGCS